MSYVLRKTHGYMASGEGWSRRAIVCNAYSGFWSIMAPVIILVGIYSGFFTPTEAATLR